MSKKITKYDVELADRIETYREEHGYTKEEMAHYMNVDIETYKRYAYKKGKIPAECVALLCTELELDLTYMMYGRDTSALDFIKYWETVSQNKLADMFYEAARNCRNRAKSETEVRDPDRRKQSMSGRKSKTGQTKNDTEK